MHTICGTMTINFTANTTMKRLREDFHEELFKDGCVTLINMDNDYLEMEIHQFEITKTDDESEDDYEE